MGKKDKTVLLAGGGGYLGVVVIRTLLDAGYRVRVVDRFFFGMDPLDSVIKEPRLEVLRADTRTVEADVFKGVDTVMDLSGLSNDPSCDLDYDATISINHGGTLRIARLARENGVRRYVFSSSCSVYGSGETRQLTEDSPYNPVSLYARTKMRCEEDLSDLASNDFVVTFLRNGTLYGLAPRMRFDLAVNLMTLSAVRRGRIFVQGGGKQWRPFVHVQDCAMAFKMAMEAPVDAVSLQAFNVGSNDQNFQMDRLAKVIALQVPDAVVDLVPDDPDKRSYNVNFDKIHDVLGFEAKRHVPESAAEIAEALGNGSTEDDIRTRTLDYYTYLLEAKKLLDTVVMDGRIL